MRSLGWVLIHCDWSPGKQSARMHGREDPVKVQEKVGIFKPRRERERPQKNPNLPIP